MDAALADAWPDSRGRLPPSLYSLEAARRVLRTNVQSLRQVSAPRCPPWGNPRPTHAFSKRPAWRLRSTGSLRKYLAPLSVLFMRPSGCSMETNSILRSLLDLLTPWCFRIYFCFLFPFTDAISCLVWGLMFTVKHGTRGLKTGRARGRGRAEVVSRRGPSAALFSWDHTFQRCESAGHVAMREFME